MSGIRPTFITGATAKIKLNGKTLAFCQDFSCVIQIAHQTPKVLGKYEGDSVEPLSYLVSGTFTIVRYAKGIKAGVGVRHTPKGLAENDAGNGVGNWGTVWGGKLGDILSRNGVGNDGRAHEAMDPSKFASGTTFDIQIYQKVAETAPGSGGNAISNLANVLQGGTNSGPGAGKYIGVLNIRNARITQAQFVLQKKAPAIERFEFVALYADGDAFVANQSGAA